ncbi:MAG: hypothetical protein H6618_01530 [Deltaproteobacteria bacterium]|nr:hypothetical protein [Deltaproteobacteria bacterium]
MLPRKPSTCLPYYHRQRDDKLPFCSIKSSEYQCLYYKSREAAALDFPESGQNKIACSLFRPLSPVRIRGQYLLPEEGLWLLKSKEGPLVAKVYYQKAPGSGRQWLLFEWVAAEGLLPDAVLLGEACSALISSVLIAASPSVLHILASVEFSDILDVLIRSGEGGEQLPRQVWSPSCYDQTAEAGIWLQSWQSSPAVWEAAHPESLRSREAESLLRLRKLRQERRRLEENKKPRKRTGFLAGLFRLAGRRRPGL